MNLKTLDRLFIKKMHRWGVPLLRVVIGGLFLWFGALKLFGLSPVADLVQQTYGWVPVPNFFFWLGAWEAVIGIMLIGKLALRFTLAMLWIHMLGTLLSPLFNPALFIQNGNPLIPTADGQYVLKNFALITAGFVIAGHDIEHDD